MQFDWMTRRALCTGESVNTVRRLPRTSPLIPDADTEEQRSLEAAFLLCWVAMADQVFLARRARVPFVAATHPFPGHLSLSVFDPAPLGPMLRGLLRLGYGVHLGRDFLELRGRGPRARLRLCGIRRAEGRELLAGIPQEARSATELPWTGCDAVLSALLRRLPLWRGVDQFAVHVEDDTVVVHWAGGPSPDDVAFVLGSPSCGIRRFSWGASTVWSVHELVVSDTGAHPGSGAERWRSWSAIAAVHAARPDPVAPRARTVLRPRVWDHDEMRAALAEGAVGAVFTLLRGKGVSLRYLAVMTGWTEEQVSEIVDGNAITGGDFMTWIAGRLGIPEGYMGAVRAGRHDGR